MRMLKPMERVLLAFEGTARGWSVHDTVQELRACQRVLVVLVEPNVHEYENTEWGDKALRVDDIRRTLGVPP